MTNPTLVPQSDEYQQIHDGIIRLVDTARTETVRSINAIMTATYWEIGRRIVEFEQEEKRERPMVLSLSNDYR